MKTRLIIMQNTESTQDEAREAAERGEPEGLAVMALKQTAGRGRAGRSWSSPPGHNLAISLVLRPTIALEETPLLGFLASIAVADLVESLGVDRAELKWPNDVLVKGRKIAGILPDARVTGVKLDYLILGIGLNVNSSEKDFPPELRDIVTSIHTLTAKTLDIEEIARNLLNRFEKLYNRALCEGCGFVIPMWRPRWAHQGRRVIRNGVEGTAESLASSGALVLRTDDGTLVEIASGDVEPTLKI